MIALGLNLWFCLGLNRLLFYVESTLNRYHHNKCKIKNIIFLVFQMFYMPVEPASASEEADLSFHVNMPLLRENLPHGIFSMVRTFDQTLFHRFIQY